MPNIEKAKELINEVYANLADQDVGDELLEKLNEALEALAD